MNAAREAAMNGQSGNAARMTNAASGNLTKANEQLNNASMRARALGLNNVANHLKNAANKVKQVKLVESMRSISNAVKALNTQ